MATEKKLTKQMSPTQMPEAARHTHLAVDKAMIQVTVSDSLGRKSPIKDAQVRVYQDKDLTDLLKEDKTDSNGEAVIEVDPGTYWVTAKAFVATEEKWGPVDLEDGGCEIHRFGIPLGFDLECTLCRDNATQATCPDLMTEGDPVRIRFNFTDKFEKQMVFLKPPPIFELSSDVGTLRRISDREAYLETSGVRGPVRVTAVMRQNPSITIEQLLNFIAQAAQSISGDVSVQLRRTATTLTPDLPLWTVIRSATGAISFNNYKKFMDDVMCGREPEAEVDTHCEHRSLPYPGVDAYSLVKCATEVFLMAHCGVSIDPQKFDFSKITLDTKTLIEEQGRYGRNIDAIQINQLWNDAYLVAVNGGRPVKTLPYLALIRSRLGEVPLKDGNGDGQAEVANCFGILRRKLENPCLLELIWSYWHEEGMLVQTMKAIGMRFQNRRDLAGTDPLMRFDIDPLRPLGNLLWGYIQDEQHRLTVVRRGYEYDHHYGITLQGRAAPPLRPVDSRSKFIEGFHNLLHLCSIFFKEDDDTTVIADGFPVMNAIREVHLLLAEGAHNQFGDLPSTARQEMLIEQWLLARPEMREFLGGRIMVPYSEVWMDRVDTVKRLQGWTDTTITAFHDLAVFGEQLLLSIRWGHWSDIHDPAHAANWVRYWRSEIQGYIHSYRAVTGVDLTPEASGPQVTDRDVQPSVHLRRRLEIQHAQRPAPAAAGFGSPRRGQRAGRYNGRQPASRVDGTREIESTEEF